MVCIVSMIWRKISFFVEEIFGNIYDIFYVGLLAFGGNKEECAASGWLGLAVREAGLLAMRCQICIELEHLK